ncbi:acyl-CoA dehydratase activase [Chloroflexota bacterium]
MMLPSASESSSNSIKAVIGVDIGSISSKAVILSDTAILAWAIVPSRGNLSTVADEVLSQVLSKAGLSVKDIGYIIATGYGAANVSSANQVANDISCQGRGIFHLFPSVRTAVDIGGQFSRAFRVDSEGQTVAFVFSERCAAGSGRLLQVIARVLYVDVQELGELSLKSKNRVDLTTGCAVFNESEAISRIAEGALKEDIAAGAHRALAAKVQSLVERLGFEPDCALVGGGAKNIGLVRSIEEKLGIKALVPPEPQLVAALGAALIAEAKVGAESSPTPKKTKRG